MKTTEATPIFSAVVRHMRRGWNSWAVYKDGAYHSGSRGLKTLKQARAEAREELEKLKAAKIKGAKEKT